MESRLSRLLVGLSVQISRSDGRVHLATVKSVDNAKSTVMVEWKEFDTCRGKEIDVSELYALNPELLVHIQDFFNKAAEPNSSPPEKHLLFLQKCESRLRPSKIPGPPTFVSRVAQTRQTCKFQPPVAVSARGSSEEPTETIAPEKPTSTLLSNSEIRNVKQEAESSVSLHLVREAVKENDEPVKNPPPFTKGRRKTVVNQELNKGNKRVSMIKPSEIKTKKGKFKEVTRPNQKFFEMIQNFRETLEINPQSSNDVMETQRICVCVRKRPLNKREVTKKEIDVVSVPGRGALLVHEPKQKVDLTKYLDNQIFQFDYSFDETSTNDLVYGFTAKPLVQSVFEGGMATCFAYGQTGSGKTHTMGGDFSGKQQNCAKGIYALAAQDVFACLSHRRYAKLDLSAYVSFFEIYNGKVYDLLNKKANLRVLEDEHQQVQVVGLEEVFVSTADEVIKMIQLGSACRTFGQTSANANSSRSHAILQIVLRSNNRSAKLHGKFSLVDLAGNERGTDVSSNERATLVETAEINRSLLALKECIRSLGKNSDHIPFRMSTLTKVLRDSFIGENSRICMIAMVSPGMASCEYTMNTLRYADRVKELNGNSKASREAKAQEPADCSSEEDAAVDTSVYDAISHVAELEEKVLAELQRANELAKEMVKTCNVEAGLPYLIDYNQKVSGSLLALQAAVEERKARLNH
nr:kinesin-like protein KIF2C isoform X3 [Nerophis lumbriciformis]